MTGPPIRLAVLVGAVVAAGLGLGWLALADLIVDRQGAATPLDTGVLSLMRSLRAPPLTAVLVVITNLGGPLAMAVACLIAVGWLSWRRQWRATWLVAATGLGAALLGPLTKDLVGRVRPPVADHLVVQTNQAFPSGHALGSFTVAGILLVVTLPRASGRRTRIALVCTTTAFVVLVGVSRLYLGVHWATDVLGGWLLAAAWLTLCFTIHALPRLRAAYRR